LLLDNFEQVITAAPLVHALLSAAPRLTVLVTSREPLQLTGEHDYAVQPMVVPAADSATMHNQILAADAVRLFVARAQAARSDFVVTSADAPVLAAICRQLDGLPLAIELAAARVKVLPLPVLLARLDQRLAVLSSRTRDVPQRQQTIRATINWSYQLLEPAEQLLFRQLGVFVGGWSLGAVEAVCGDGSDNLVQLLEQLVEKSLVTPRIGIQDALRFNMLETIREFAIEQLTLHGELEQLQRRHAEYFLRLVEAAEPQLYGPDQKIWLDVIDQEHDNVRTVLTWSLAVGDTQAIGLQLASLLIYFWAVRSYAHEGVAWMKQLLELTIRGDLVLRAKALVAVGSLAENHSQLKEAIVYLEEAVSLYRNLEDDKGIALALMYIGRCKYWQTAYSEAQPLLAESLSHFQGLGDRTWMMWAFLSLGDCAFYGDDVRSAQRYFAQALELSQQLEDQHGYGWAMLCLSRTEWALTQNDLAHRHAHTALEVFQRLQQKTEAAHAELELARIAEGQDNLPAAYDWYARSLTQFSHQRLQRVPECLEGISSLIVRVAPDRATRMLGAAFTLRVAISIPLPLIYRAAYERSIAEARAALSAESFDAAFAAGQALTLDDAVAEALEMAVLKASAAN
jgi:predicted ATPase